MNIPAKELKRQARSALMGRYTKPMTAYAITQLIVMGANFPFELMLKSNPTILQMVLSGLAAIIISFLSGVFICGQLFIHLNMARGKQAHRTDVFRFFTRRPDYPFGNAHNLHVACRHNPCHSRFRFCTPFGFYVLLYFGSFHLDRYFDPAACHHLYLQPE